MATYTVTIRNEAEVQTLARLAGEEIREPEQQLNWLVEKMLKQNGKTKADKPATLKRGPRSAAA